MVQQKDEAVSKQQRRAMAGLLETGKVESAKIRVENIIRSDITTELHEILELYCELLLARTGLMEAQTCDPGLEEAVKSLIYAAPRTDVKELQTVRALLVDKYGKEFGLAAMEPDEHVAEKVLKKLAVTPPSVDLVNGYLEEIARTYGVDWPKRPTAELGEPPEYVDDDDDENPSGGQAQKNLEEPILATGVKGESEREELSKATPPRNFGPSSPLRVNPPSPSTDNLHPRVRVGTVDLKPTKKIENVVKTGGGTVSKGPVGGTIPDVDELSKRFAALKK
jgi:vacuolar protein sorting-associated protein IST1